MTTSSSELFIALGGNTVNIDSGGLAHFHWGDSSESDGEAVMTALEPHSAPNALYNALYHEEPARCHPGTREGHLKDLHGRFENVGRTSKNFMWIHGPAGVGKTAVMRTFCERLALKTQLLGSFFFKGDDTRNSGRPFVLTLTYQLCLAIPELRLPIHRALRQNPALLRLSLDAQAVELIVQPIQLLVQHRRFVPRPPQAIIIDGLDECETEFDRSQVIRVLVHLSQIYPCPLLFFIASRPHSDIRDHFERAPLLNKTQQQRIYRDSDADADILRYLIDNFDDIARTHRLRRYLPIVEGRWPSLAVINGLVDRASGQFIFPVTIIRFVRPNRVNPDHRLQILLGVVPAGDLQPFEQLDALYRAIFATIESSLLQSTLDVLATCVLHPTRTSKKVHPVPWLSATTRADRYPYRDARYGEYPTTGQIGLLLGGRTSYCRELLVDLEALIEVDEGPDADDSRSTFRLYHKSLEDFLRSESRAGAEMLVTVDRAYAALVAGCFRQCISGCLDVQTDVLVIPLCSGLWWRRRLVGEASQWGFYAGSIAFSSPRFIQIVATNEPARQTGVSWSYGGPTDDPDRFIQWLASSCNLLVGLMNMGLGAECQPHWMCFEAFLESYLSPYKKYPELSALLAISLSGTDHQDSRDLKVRERYNLASSILRAIQESSPNLFNLDRKDGLRLVHSEDQAILDLSAADKDIVCLRSIVSKSVFAQESVDWVVGIGGFLDATIRSNRPCVPVSRIVISHPSFHYALSSISPRAVSEAEMAKKLQDFLNAFRHILPATVIQVAEVYAELYSAEASRA